MKLDEYVAWKAQHPDEEIDLTSYLDSMSGIHRLMVLHAQCEPYGIAPEAIFGAALGDARAMDDIALVVLKALLAERQRREKGQTHLRASDVMPVDLRQALLATTLLAARRNRAPLSSCFTLALVEQLGGLDGRQLDKALEKQINRLNSLNTAADMLAAGEEPSTRSVAARLGISHTTVSRLFPRGTLLAKATQFLKLRSPAANETNA